MTSHWTPRFCEPAYDSAWCFLKTRCKWWNTFFSTGPVPQWVQQKTDVTQDMVRASWSRAAMVRVQQRFGHCLQGGRSQPATNLAFKRRAPRANEELCIHILQIFMEYIDFESKSSKKHTHTHTYIYIISTHIYIYIYIYIYNLSLSLSKLFPNRTPLSREWCTNSLPPWYHRGSDRRACEFFPKWSKMGAFPKKNNEFKIVAWGWPLATTCVFQVNLWKSNCPSSAVNCPCLGTDIYWMVWPRPDPQISHGCCGIDLARRQRSLYYIQYGHLPRNETRHGQECLTFLPLRIGNG